MAKKKLLENLNLPRGYISPSQISLWKSSKEKYRERYYQGKEGFTNEAMRFGSKVSKRIETGEESDDELVELLIKGGALTIYEKVEYPLTWFTPNGVKVYGKLDTATADYKRIREYKTGKHPWTQRKANSHMQTQIYIAGVYTNCKFFPVVHLDWIPTEEKNGRIGLANKPIVPLQVEASISGVYETYREIEKVAEEIAADYTNYQNSLI